MFQLALYVLSFLGPKDLLQAAQTCRYWRVLTEDNLLWREKCKEESIDESLVFGTNRLRRRQPSPKSPWKSLYMRQHQIEQNWRSGPIRTPKVRWKIGLFKEIDTSERFCYHFVKGGNFCRYEVAFQVFQTFQNMGAILRGKKVLPLGANSFL